MEPSGTTLLAAACAHDLSGVCLALTSGVDPAHLSTEGCTALMLVCTLPQGPSTLSLIQALVSGDGRACIDWQSQDGGFSALMLAARCGSGAAVQALIEAGAALELLDDLGKTAWQAADASGHCDVVEALRGAGARGPSSASNTLSQPQLVPVQIPRVEGGCSATRFASQFRGRMPVVLTGAASHWAACTAWADRATFEARLGGASRELPCLHSSDNRRFASVTSASAASSGGHSSSCSPHSVAEVLAAVHADGGPRMQVQLAMDEALLQDVEAIDGLPVGASESPEPANSVWLCSGGTETPLHFEERHGTFVQVVGCTRLVVFPPDEHPHLYPFSAREGDPFASRVDLSSWRQGDPSECFMWPRLARSHCLEATLQPGDAAYIPAGYWYHQTALSPSVAVRAAFDMSRAEQRTQARPWALPCWGRASLPIVGPTGLSRAILLPSTESDDLQRRLGAGVWASAFVLADELLQGDSWQQVLCGARVLELGAGATGYPGMVAALRGGASTCVMLTDKHSDLVDGLRQVLDEMGLPGSVPPRSSTGGRPLRAPRRGPLTSSLRATACTLTTPRAPSATLSMR